MQAWQEGKADILRFALLTIAYLVLNRENENLSDDANVKLLEFLQKELVCIKRTGDFSREKAEKMVRYLILEEDWLESETTEEWQKALEKFNQKLEI